MNASPPRTLCNVTVRSCIQILAMFGLFFQTVNLLFLDVWIIFIVLAICVVNAITVWVGLWLRKPALLIIYVSLLLVCTVYFLVLCGLLIYLYAYAENHKCDMMNPNEDHNCFYIGSYALAGLIMNSFLTGMIFLISLLQVYFCVRYFKFQRAIIRINSANRGNRIVHEAERHIKPTAAYAGMGQVWS